MFKKYDLIEDYNADTLAPDEKRVSLIMDRDYVVDVKYDAPMREVTLPAVGDALFIENNGGAKHFYRNAKTNLVPNGLTLVGFVFKVKGNKVKILNKSELSYQWLGCWQYAITEITKTNITLGLRLPNSYGAETTFNIALPSAQINSATVSAINTALANTIYWAYLAKADGALTTNDAEGVKIIIQCDSCNNYQQSNVTGTNCTISLCVWDDMPGSAAILRDTKISANWGVMNVAKAVTYYSTNGSTPSSNVSINAIDLVKRVCFEDSTNPAYGYCSALRTAYGTYESYIIANKVKYPQRYGAFNMPDAAEMARLYGNSTAQTKTGGILYKFPALHYCATINYNSDGLTAGNWHLSDITDGMEYMDDSVLSIIAAAQRRISVTAISNSLYCWFACRKGANIAWNFSGGNGDLYTGNVHNSMACRAVTELTLTFPNNNQNNS